MALDQTRINDKSPEMFPEMRKREKKPLGELTANGELICKEAGLSSIPIILFQDSDSILHLDARDNIITTIDSFPIQKLKNLQTLDLRNNRIDSLIESLGDLKNLQTLKLDNNLLSSLPSSLKSLKELKFLSICNNNFSFLPSSVTELRNLKTLSISENKIRYLPPTIGDLKSLQVLHIHKNHFCQLPLTLYSLDHLKELSLEWFRYTIPPLPKVLKSHIGEAMIMSLKSLCSSLYVNKYQECSLLDFLQHFSEGNLKINQVDSKKRSLVHTAAIEGDHGVVLGLIKSNIDVDLLDKDGLSALCLSIKAEQMDCAKALIECGADINEGGGALGSALHLAAFLVKPWLVRELLRRRADVNLRDCEGNTPLHIILGVFNKNKISSQIIADILIEAGAQVNALNKESWAPIHLAARRGQNNSIKWAVRQNKILKKAGREQIDFNLQGGSHYWTPMHLAGHAGHFEIVELLVHSGANLFIRNSDGRTPRQSSKGDLALFKYLVRAERESLRKQVLGKNAVEIIEGSDKEEEFDPDAGHLWKKYAAGYQMAKKGKRKEIEVAANKCKEDVVKSDLVYMLGKLLGDVRGVIKDEVGLTAREVNWEVESRNETITKKKI